MKIICSVNSYETLILETKTSQSSLSFQELQIFVKSQRLGKYSNIRWKGQISSGFNEICFSSCSDDHWLDRCKKKSVAKQRNYIKDKCFRKERKGLRLQYYYQTTKLLLQALWASWKNWSTWAALLSGVRGGLKQDCISFLLIESTMYHIMKSTILLYILNFYTIFLVFQLMFHLQICLEAFMKNQVFLQ